MMASDLKRKVSSDKSISPPPTRRKIQSGTTQTAVASFFTPSSQKPPEKTLWHERGPDDDTPATLLVGRYEGSDAAHLPSATTGMVRRKIAAFDFDSTLIQTSSGKKHSSDAQDWKWWYPTVPGILRKLYLEEGYQVVIISNQAGLTLKANPKTPKSNSTRLAAFKNKVGAVLTELSLPVTIYAATEKDMYRKPRIGMWTELLEDNDLNTSGSLDLQNSFFVGDAGGRLFGNGKPKDFSCSDRNFASNVGITFYTPEEYFLKEAPRPFLREFDPSSLVGVTGVEQDGQSAFIKKNEQELVIFCGSPGSGKSTFYWKHLKSLDYVRVNQDILKTREKCIRVAGENLSEGKSVAVDNTNADSEARAKWVELAAKHNVPIRCILFLADRQIAEHNDVVRALNHSMNPEKRNILPMMAFTGFASRYKRPDPSEGFQDITEVSFKGTATERDIWTRYWT